jgi:hypothetical protein
MMYKREQRKDIWATVGSNWVEGEGGLSSSINKKGEGSMKR